MTPEALVTVVQTAALGVTSLLLAYPLVRRSHHVVHRRGFLSLSGGFFVLTVGYIVGLVSPGPLQRLVFLAAAMLGLLGSWYFARPFLRLEDDSGALDGTQNMKEVYDADGFGSVYRD